MQLLIHPVHNNYYIFLYMRLQFTFSTCNDTEILQVGFIIIILLFMINAQAK